MIVECLSALVTRVHIAFRQSQTLDRISILEHALLGVDSWMVEPLPWLWRSRMLHDAHLKPMTQLLKPTTPMHPSRISVFIPNYHFSRSKSLRPPLRKTASPTTIPLPIFSLILLVFPSKASSHFVYPFTSFSAWLNVTTVFAAYYEVHWLIIIIIPVSRPGTNILPPTRITSAASQNSTPTQPLSRWAMWTQIVGGRGIRMWCGISMLTPNGRV